MSWLTLFFHGDTRELLRRSADQLGMTRYLLDRRASIKDIVEALGVVHTEIGKIVVDNRETAFSLLPGGGETIDIYPQSAKIPVTKATVLRPEPLPAIRFAADTTVGKLTRMMRMAGFDVETIAATGLREKALAATRNNRIILSRNTDLLRCREVTFARLLRSGSPQKQLQEVIHLYDLGDQVRPLTRCMLCNQPLSDVAKADIVHRLQPLTIKYYHAFRQCTDCGRIYWRGSHCESMMRNIEDIET